MRKKSDLDKKLEALPDNTKAARKWSFEEDAAVLRFSESKGFEAVGRVLGVSGMAVRRRFALLQQQTKSKRA